MTTSLPNHALGKWELILREAMDESLLDKRHHACPGSGDGKDCFRFSDEKGKGNFFCKCSDGSSDGFDLLRCINGWNFQQAAEFVEGVIGKPDGPPPEKPKPHWIRQYAREAKAAPRSRYLEARGLSPADPLRFHRAVPYYHEGEKLGEHPAMIAPIYVGQKVKGCHVTYLNGDQKADVPSPRKVYSESSIREGFIPLGGSPQPDEAGQVWLGVAEGIETALAASRMSGATVWACLNTSLLKNFTPPSGVEGVAIYGDNDHSFAGHAAGYRLAERLCARGLKVNTFFPKAPGQDWNDVLMDKLNRGVA